MTDRTRNLPTVSVVAALTIAAAEATIAAKETFTAYDITTKVRLAHPELEILHREVRPIVHVAAQRAVDEGSYRNHNERGMTVYTPVVDDTAADALDAQDENDILPGSLVRLLPPVGDVPDQDEGDADDQSDDEGPGILLGNPDLVLA